MSGSEIPGQPVQPFGSENAAEHMLWAQEHVAERLGWITDAVEIVAGDRARDPLDALPEALEVRDDAPDTGLSVAQESELREIAGRFGIGGETDIVSSTLVQVNEAGKPWKIEGEDELTVRAQTVIYAGSPHVAIGDDERSYLEAKYASESDGVVSIDYQYDMARFLAAHSRGFEALPEPIVMPFGYDIANDHALVTDPTGQLIQIGTRHDNQQVMLLRVDREDYFDEQEQQNRYRNQPDGAAILRFVGNVLRESGDDISSIGYNTSSTYASRQLDVVRAGIDMNRKLEVGMYGRQTLADVRGLPEAKLSPINQIPGELRVMYEKLQALQEAIS